MALHDTNPGSWADYIGSRSVPGVLFTWRAGSRKIEIVNCGKLIRDVSRSS
jgi:hypothetical protein